LVNPSGSRWWRFKFRVHGNDPMTKVFREVIARTLKSVAKTSSV
jgi:hypothetical protein